MARGIDTCAHQGALAGHGRTIAVLGCGVDVVYPPENDRLAEQILEEGGLIISEYVPGTRPYPGNFPARNRIISGMTPGTLLVEGAAGVGKTEIAKVMAAALDRDLVRLQCYEGLDESKALYEWNYQKQLLSIQVNMNEGDKDALTILVDKEGPACG